MTIEKFAKDLEKFDFKVNIKENLVEVDYEEIQFILDIDEDWTKAITKIYKSKQYDLNCESKFMISNNIVEFQIFRLTPSYYYRPCYEFTSDNSDIVVLSSMSRDYHIRLFQSGDFNHGRVLNRLKSRYKSRSERIASKTPRFHINMEDLFLRLNSISFHTKRRIERKELIEIGKQKCKSCMLKLAISHNECWELRETIKTKGFNIPMTIDDSSGMTIPKSIYEDDLVSFYKVAKSSLFTTQSFLSYYHVLEFNFLRVADEELFNKTKSIINSTSFNSSYENVNKLLSVLQKHEKNLDETNMLKRVLSKYIDEEELIKVIQELEKSLNETIYSKPKEEIFGEKIPIKLEVGHTIANTARAVKHIRNSLVHSSDKYTREECVIPFSTSELIVMKYIPIIRFLAEKVIYANAK